MISVSEALAKILNQASIGPTIQVPLEESLGFVLGEDILADRDLPPFNRSMMDGYCIRAQDLPSGTGDLKNMGIIPAGSPPEYTLLPGQTYKIMTGAILANGADTVIKKESTSSKEDQIIFNEPNFKPGMFVALQGEDVLSGVVILAAGSVLTPAAMAVCASVGITSVKVRKKPSLSIISTGNEIISAHNSPLPHQIRDCNSYSLSAYAKLSGIQAQTLGITEDHPEKLREQVLKGLKSNILILTGGVSMGDFDYVPKVLSECGVKKVFHKVRLKPGKPLWFGLSSSGTAVFGLPGNPVSAQIGFALFIEPYIQKVMQAFFSGHNFRKIPLRITCQNLFDLELYQPARLINEEGKESLQPIPIKSSGDFSNFAQSMGLARFPESQNRFFAGQPIEFLPWKT